MGHKQPIFSGQFDCKFNKVASAVVNEELLKAIAEEKTYFYIRMTTYEDIQKAINIFKPIALLSLCIPFPLPMKDEDANLQIDTLRKNLDVMLVIVTMRLGWQFLMPAALGKALLKDISPWIGLCMDQTNLPPSTQRFATIGGGSVKSNAMGDGEKRILEAEVPIAQKLVNT